MRFNGNMSKVLKFMPLELYSKVLENEQTFVRNTCYWLLLILWDSLTKHVTDGTPVDETNLQK